MRPGLTDTQRGVLRAFFRPPAIRESFVLAGGTALACFHLHHRWSNDLDFFCLSSESLRPAAEHLRACLQREGLETVSEKDYGSQIVMNLAGDAAKHPLSKIDLVASPARPLRPHLLYDDAVVFSLADIAADKLAAAVGRRELKDLIDLLAIDRDGRVSLSDVLGLVSHKHPRFHSLVLAQSLREVREIEHEFDEFRVTYLAEPWTFRDLARFCHRFAHEIDRTLPDPRPGQRRG